MKYFKESNAEDGSGVNMRSFGMKEPVNTLTHLITLITAVVGLVFLVVLSMNNISKLVTMTIYGASVILLYLSSTIYHWAKTTPRKTIILRKLDHAAIYLLIAGSYTPVFFYGLKGSLMWVMLAAVWILAATGVLLKISVIEVSRNISTVFYIALGWIALVPFVQLFKNLPAGALYLMAAGGAAYTFGAIIYATRCFNFFPNRFGFHEIFHLFISAGSIIHFIMMVRYIVPL